MTPDHSLNVPQRRTSPARIGERHKGGTQCQEAMLEPVKGNVALVGRLVAGGPCLPWSVSVVWKCSID